MSLYGQNDADLLFERGYNYLTTDRSQAIRLLSQCIKTDPSYTQAYYHRGIAYFKDGEYEKALSNFEKISADKTNLYFKSQFNMALIYVQQDNKAKARVILKDIINRPENHFIKDKASLMLKDLNRICYY